MEPLPQAEDLALGQEIVPAGHHEAGIARQAVGQRTEERGGLLVPEQVEVIQKEISLPLPGQRGAEVVQQQGRAAGVRGALVPLQHGQPGLRKRLLQAFPEDGPVGGVDAHPQHGGSLPAALVQVPVDGGGLAVAHGSHHRRQAAAGNGLQAVPHPLRDVDGIQFRLLSEHPRPSFLFLLIILPQISRSWK